MSAVAAVETGEWPIPEPEFLTRRKAAAIAQVAVATVARWQREGKLGLYGHAGHRLVKTAELRAYLDPTA